MVTLNKFPIVLACYYVQKRGLLIELKMCEAA